ncbi:helix-turn-helix domain-containing protein [Sorangium sp. So ce363]|uniref:helix-turn-helix domain-containing protein n=1 Tax=Sorangium sp. So ce363 TaxID=3133304 RepID=UPI003F5E554A
MPSAGPILDGDLLRAFVAFADPLNFTHAARRVGLSQPALFERRPELVAEPAHPLGLGVAVVNGICAPPRGVILRPVPELGTVCYRLVTRRGAELPPAAERLAARIVEIGKGAARAG